MAEVTIKMLDNGKGSFKLTENGDEIGEMTIGILGTSIRIYHTEVDPEYEGKGMAKKLLDAMAAYARENQLKVTPLCAYVHAQFKRHPETYADIWNNASAR